MENSLSLLERLVLMFVPKKKKVLVDTDTGTRVLYTMEYKIFRGVTFITKLYEGI
jgi:hypothetical protein